ncbi:MAG: DUF5606 domain-containing protein [Bacteroidales bacterium]|nr:DUF5606 domain-containing protein [Bacteroidales bacterium]
MTLKDIYTIAGYSGLFKYVAQGRNGIIVEGIEDKKRMNAFATMKVSSLGDISVFTQTGDIPLIDILKRIREKENSNPGPETKDPKVLQVYFESILPEYDKERVHQSDIKKIVSWYNLLQKNNLLGVLDEEEKTDVTEEKEEKKTTEDQGKEEKS